MGDKFFHFVACAEITKYISLSNTGLKLKRILENPVSICKLQMSYTASDPHERMWVAFMLFHTRSVHSQTAGVNVS